MRRTFMLKSSPVAYDHEENVKLSIQLNRWLLKPLGVWPKSADLSRLKKFIYVTVNVVCLCLICFLLVPSVVFMAVEIEGTYNTIKLTGPLSFCLMTIAKYSSLICRESYICSGLRHIEDDWTNTRYYGDRMIMIRNAKFGRRLVTICAFFMYGGAVFYYLALPFSNGKIKDADLNLTYRPLLFPVARIIADARYSPVSEIFFWVQCLAGFIAHSITAGACSLAAAFAMHACGRLEVLMEWIEHLVDGREDLCDNVDERLTMIVQQHVRILRFISLTDTLMREISAVEIIGCTLNMCLLGYYTIMEWDNKTNIITYIILYMSFMFNIFIFCYIGELIAGQKLDPANLTYYVALIREHSGMSYLGIPDAGLIRENLGMPYQDIARLESDQGTRRHALLRNA
ncbi:uncharacterized protein LOC109852537 [Pseudomyrmex gracilis]|uniref:uncharacterized protein LOC109852537 n=1 Tax=Pseudomyrmex gracilis TaxID=219809 RepID=UPI0009950274|nr:uncharacterized protein LOC109852537 [Pseudomyrmex gracilis]